MDDNKKVIFNTNLIYFVCVVCFIIIRICAEFRLFSFLGDTTSYVLSLVTQVGLIFLLPFLLFKKLNKTKTKETFKFFSFRKISFKAVVVSVVIGIIVFFLNVYISSFFNSIISIFGYEHTPSTSKYSGEIWALFLNLVCTAVLPAVAEETLHRGMLLSGNSSLGMKKSIIISGFLFGLFHLNIEQTFYAIIIGLFLGYICWGSNSIYPCMIIHFMNNAMSVFLSFARARGWSIGHMFTYISEFLSKNASLGILMFILAMSILVIVLFELVKILFKDSLESGIKKRQKEFANMAIRDSYFKQIADIKDGNIIEQERNVVYVDIKDFMKFVDRNLENIIKSVEENEIKSSPPKLEKRTKIFMIGSFVLTTIVTIMTFIWGIL